MRWLGRFDMDDDLGRFTGLVAKPSFDFTRDFVRLTNPHQWIDGDVQLN